MTTKEMNRVIDRWVCDTINGGGIYTDCDTWHTDWNMLMYLWQKLRGELIDFMIKIQNEKPVNIELNNKVVDIRADIENAIITTDITTAHRLMVEAIELIKK